VIDPFRGDAYGGLMDLRPLDDSTLPALRTVLAHASVAAQYDAFAGPDGVERLLADRFIPRELVRIALVDGAPAGFALAVLLPGARPWAMLRGAVLPPFRRRGIGRALHAAVRAGVDAAPSPVLDLAIGAAEPFDAVEPFVTSLGYRPERTFWYMRRERGRPAAEPQWPAGITLRTFDGSEAMLVDWNDAYNDSFSRHWRFVPSPIEHVRDEVVAPGFEPSGLLLAYRDGRVVGFCRCARHPERGEIAVLGTVAAARGIGLGRALLRWGAAWLEQAQPHPVTLLVDGDNETALSLYRSEGFEVTKRRRVWSQPRVGA
jgi:mycothiol synthase